MDIAQTTIALQAQRGSGSALAHVSSLPYVLFNLCFCLFKSELTEQLFFTCISKRHNSDIAMNGRCFMSNKKFMDKSYFCRNFHNGFY